jgi:hypothetical protein
MKIRQFTNLPGISTSLRIAAATSLAAGVAASFSAAPAGAVSITSGTLFFADGVINTNVVGGGSIAPVAGNRFSANFNRVNSATIDTATGSFAAAGLAPGPRYIASSSADYLFNGGNTYTQLGDLVFDIGQQVTANPLVARLTVGNGSIFTTTSVANTTTFAFLSGSATFLTQPDGILSQLGLQPGDFRFTVDNLASNNPANPLPNGSYSLIATTAIPEPFTVIGTIVGGTAAFRMRKKLANSAKN